MDVGCVSSAAVNAYQQTYAAVHEKFNDWMNPTETE